MFYATMKVSDSFKRKILSGENPIKDGYIYGNIDVNIDRNRNQITFIIRDSGGVGIATCGPIDIYGTVRLSGVGIRLDVNFEDTHLNIKKSMEFDEWW